MDTYDRRKPPGDKITVDKLPGGRIEVRAAPATGRISEVFGSLKRRNGPCLSFDEVNRIAAQDWTGRSGAGKV